MTVELLIPEALHSLALTYGTMHSGSPDNCERLKGTFQQNYAQVCDSRNLDDEGKKEST